MQLQKILSNKFVKSAFESAGILYFFFLLNFVCQIFLARLLLPEFFGIIATVLAIVGVVEIFFALSIPMAYISYEDEDKLFGTAFLLTLLEWLALVIVSLLIYFPLSIYYSSEVAELFVFICVFKVFSRVGNLLLADLEKTIAFRKSALISGFSSSLSLVIAILMATNGLGVESLLAREVLAPLLVFLFCFLWSKRKLKFEFDRGISIRLLRYSMSMIVSRGNEIAYYRLPVLVVGKLYGETVLGYLTQMFYIAQLCNKFLGPFTEKVSFVFFARNKRSGQRKINKSLIIVSMGSFVVTIPLVISIII